VDIHRDCFAQNLQRFGADLGNLGGFGRAVWSDDDLDGLTGLAECGAECGSSREGERILEEGATSDH
jgi:hypothetical protein